MSFIDVTGKTEEEAIRKALEQLQKDRDDVSVEILERAKSGFLGIGSSPAKVRVTYADPEPAAAPVPEKKAEPKPEKKPDRPQQPPKAAAPAKTEKPEKKAEPAAQKPAPKADGVCTDENAERIVAFLEGLLQHMNSNASVKVYETEKGRYKAVLVGEKLGQFIGRRGETLDAIQHLTNYAVNRGSDKHMHISVDAESYRAKREESLVRLAEKMAAKAIKYKRSMALEPMNSYERHVIHTALQDYEGVTTSSTGTEPNRRVVVSYEKPQRPSNKPVSREWS